MLAAMAKNLARLGLGLLVVAILTGCTTTGNTDEELPVATLPPATADTATPTPTPTPEAQRGSRANPLAIGEYRALSADSMWTVGAEAPTVVNDGYIVLPLRIGMDWEVGRQTAAEQGIDVDAEGLNLYESLFVSYVSASGRSYTTLDDLSIEIPNDFYLVGTLYPPVEAVSASVAVSIPAAEIPGGTWSVEDLFGDGVFIQ